jgi:lysophospholipase L1-like esterase
LVATAAAALLLLLAALDAERRLLFLVVGIAAAATAFFAKRFLRNYTGVALIALNTFLLLVAIEVASAIVLSVAYLPATKRVLARWLGQPNDLIEQHYLGLPYYANADWARQYWGELRRALRKTYHPYVIWRSPAFTGETLNVDPSGRRATLGAECSDESLDVFVFGGSAMWGWGAPDWGTIPEYLQRRLAEKTDQAVCVTNFGENAFVSTQSLIQLLLELQSSNVPDMVIFYDGVNDVLAAHQNGEPILHQNLSEIAQLFSRPQSSLSLVRRLNAFKLLEQVSAQLLHPDADGRPSPTRDDRLPDAIVASYMEIQSIVASLAERHDFEYAFFWQPHILAGEKPLTPTETGMITGLNWALNLNDELTRLFETTYGRIAAEADNSERLFDLARVFDHVQSQIWIDTWGHTTPEGNELVAEAIVEALTRSSVASDTSPIGP